jgi:hypothetical protein
MSIVTIGSATQHTELVDLQFLPMQVQYPSLHLVDLDDADGRTPLRQTDSLSNLSYDGYTIHNLPWCRRTQRNVDWGGAE